MVVAPPGSPDLNQPVFWVTRSLRSRTIVGTSWVAMLWILTAVFGWPPESDDAEDDSADQCDPDEQDHNPAGARLVLGRSCRGDRPGTGGRPLARLPWGGSGALAAGDGRRLWHHARRGGLLAGRAVVGAPAPADRGLASRCVAIPSTPSSIAWAISVARAYRVSGSSAERDLDGFGELGRDTGDEPSRRGGRPCCCLSASSVSELPRRAAGRRAAGR